MTDNAYCETSDCNPIIRACVEALDTKDKELEHFKLEQARWKRRYKELEKELQKYKVVVEAAKRMMNFDLEQYLLHKAAGDYKHRDKNTLALLDSIANLKANE